MTNLNIVANWEDANESKRQLLNRFSNLSSVRNERRKEFFTELDKLFSDFEKKDVTPSNNLHESTVS